jgi:hypothetical protein
MNEIYDYVVSFLVILVRRYKNPNHICYRSQMDSEVQYEPEYHIAKNEFHL